MSDPQPAATFLERATSLVKRAGQTVAKPLTRLSSRLDLLDSANRRTTVSGSVRTMDEGIPGSKRRGLTLTTHYVQQNFAVAAWAIRKHLDFTSSFNFEAQTGDPGLDRELERLMDWYSRPDNCHSSGQHSLHRIIRLAEAGRLLDGDVFLMKLANGKIQPIEGNRIDTPGVNVQDITRTIHNGVEVNRQGRAVRYAVHGRGNGVGLQFERWIPARNIMQHGFFDRFDQIRGVSPFITALAPLQDVYENFTYALAKSKAAQLFGITFYRDAPESGDWPIDGEDTDGDGTDDRYNVELGTRPLVLDLEPGDKAEFLENKTPATEFQQFNQAIIGMALKSLDIPFSFYDESFTNFFGSMAAQKLYLKAAREKRRDVQELLRKITAWRLGLFIQDGDLTLPSGTTLENIHWEWIADGLPWFRPKEEVGADIMAIQAGLKTREMVTRERHGTSWRELAARLAAEKDYLAELGLPTSTDLSAQTDQREDEQTPGGNILAADDTAASLKELLNNYGVGVRAGTITPQVADEQAFREMAGLPPLSPAAAAVWTDEKTRRPVTLAQPGKDLPVNAIAPEDPPE
jgi:capsid protein